MNTSQKKSKVVSYNKWGYIFLIPFALTYIVFQFIPLVSTIVNSFFEHYYKMGLTEVGPNFVGLKNYVTYFKTGDLWAFGANTMIMWIIGFIPQILVSLLLAQWFSDVRLRVKGAGFFKTVIYLPNLIMAAAFAMLFSTLFEYVGPVNGFLRSIGAVKEGVYFFSTIKPNYARILVGFINFLMWFGNTTILLMSGIMSIDTSLYEAAEVDGANSWTRFFQITMPLLRPIFVYVLITSLIGGLQMFDVPQILNKGMPANTTKTLIMDLNTYLTSKNYGMGGAISVILFIVTGALSMVVYAFMYRKKDKE